METQPMPRILHLVPVRTLLVADGALCLAMGTGLMALRGVLAGPTGLDPAFLAWAGALLLPVGVFILATAAGRVPARLGLATTVAGNLAWAAASVILPAVGVIEPTPLGLALVLAQAGAVAVVAVLEARGLGRAEALA
jgi:hypothetical protein